MQGAILRVKVIGDNPELVQLYKSHKAAYVGDCGIDLYTAHETIVPARSSKLVDTGVVCALGDDSTHRLYSYDLRSRSSIYKTPLIQQNGVGTVDKMYTGPLMMAVYNLSESDYTIEKHTRLCQVVGPNLMELTVRLVNEMDTNTERGSSGFGSSGV
jgi:deoxyuridine 5'-triphosphate nucleotidohydrolase